jgi:hypothetical protein
LFVTAVVLAALSPFTRAKGQIVLFSTTALNDLGTKQYCPGARTTCYEGGLYENGTNVVPKDHNSIGLSFAGLVRPLNTEGRPSATGKIGVLSIGMSNAGDEWQTFTHTYQDNPGLNPAVVFVSGASGTHGSPCDFTVPFDNPNLTCGGTLAQNPYDWIQTSQEPPLGLTDAQIQVIWLKFAEPFTPQYPPPTLPSPSANALVYEAHIGGMLRAFKQRYPNIQLVFQTSRIYGGYSGDSKNPEPYAFEYGFSSKWAIEAQILQADRGGAPDPTAGDLSYTSAPWTAWGPYIWADGPVPRLDGFKWCDVTFAASYPRNSPCGKEQDFEADGLHGNTLGDTKVAAAIWTFFTTSPETSGWFNAP